MNLLCIGDIVGQVGCDFLRQKLPPLKKTMGIDFVVANGENASDGNGITPKTAEFLFQSGVDVITLGNHAFRRNEIYDYLDEEQNIIRPANLPDGTTPGQGFCIVDKLKYKVAVINLMGNYGMQEGLACPYKAADEALIKVEEAAVKVIDFHAEATSEKVALGYYLEGRVSAIFGTHTHVQTSDEAVLEGGTGYITDAGMTGPERSVLGIKTDVALKRFLTKLPVRSELAPLPCRMECVVFNIDEKNGKAISAESLRVK